MDVHAVLLGDSGPENGHFTGGAPGVAPLLARLLRLDEIQQAFEARDLQGRDVVARRALPLALCTIDRPPFLPASARVAPQF